MAGHHSPSPSFLSPPPPPQQQQQEDEAPSTSDRLDIIRQIALTNQLMYRHNSTTLSLLNPPSVPWEELRKVLKDELEQVLDSNQLTYTASRVTNPLTTALTAIPNTATTITATSIAEEAASSIVDATIANQEHVATGGEAVSTDATTTIKTSDDDQPHVPEHDQEQRQQTQETQAQDAVTTATVAAAADAAVKKPEESASEAEEGQATSSETSSVSKNDTPDGAEAKDKENHEGSNGPTPVGKHGEDDKKEKTPEQQEQEQLASEDTATVIPISINTLVIETPQGYHDRIKCLLDAFSSAPFTIQRVCELISSPTEHHTNLIKYLRAVEKVLMITSSINEFSNPAYNGPSALDEKDDDPHQDRDDRTINGDYTQSRNLDFSLITKRPSSDGSDGSDEDDEFEAGVQAARNSSNMNDKEAYDAVLADVDAFEAQFGKGKDVKLEDEDLEDEDEEGLPSLEAVGDAADTTTTATTAAGDVAEEMDVDVDQVAAGAATTTSTMEGVESETATEGSMEVDQA
ncbi:protein phosphatase 4, regulatory subunit 2 [Linnemannia gamsii]|uniref:Protein phosphatase 4, regulatory subunit 2 n=1 Tax=Linnemannia gamsii TaxID=64522 RepID=A0ABQ7JI44_9FUNG|nr:protein phosphatase 4, regulatory subunit 2 [Linnemannia gamsii]